MKILLASSSSGSRGGGELYLLYLGRALAERGHEAMLWASAHPRMNELAEKWKKDAASQKPNQTSDTKKN